MNKYLLKPILLIFVALSVFGQNSLLKRKNFSEGNNTYRIDSIPFNGVSLNRGWKYILEDSSVFATPSFNDTHWDTTKIDKKLSFFKTKNDKVGWFRKKLFIDSTLVQQAYILRVQIAGAAEIYLNGELIHKIGEIGNATNPTDKKYIKEVMPYAIVFKNAGQQTLAIRFLFSTTPLLAGNMDFYPLSLRLQKLESFEKKDNASSIMFAIVDGICLGLFLMMTIIHFLFHYFFRSDRYNILFSSSMFIFCIFFWISNGMFNEIPIDWAIMIFFLKRVLFPIAHLILLAAVYEYLKIEKKQLFWAVIVFFLSSNILIYFTKADDIFLVILYTLLLINYVFLIRYSQKNGNINGKALKSAFFLFLGFSISLTIVLGIYFIFISPISSKAEFTKISLAFTPIFVVLFAVGPQLSVSAAISLSLAEEFVKNNIILKQKIVEIEKLSNEKEHILSSQNETLEKQVKIRTEELNNSLQELKSTQAQLIQSEKLASLGELTAGIAHEIQNPLNFVNNFSELSIELIEELKSPLTSDGGIRDGEKVDMELFEDVVQNLEKINLHGKRASSIVKGMLEHSRASTGVKELTDINALADEYLRLSYHGLRAKDNSFNADFKTDFDENLPKIAVVPQDFGRVLLNLINNAFYAVSNHVHVETGHALSLPKQSQYKPIVIISTKQIDNQLIIKIKDNGTGMSEATKAKIFQPFFTTKPTGEGTGLGLSLAYDIITKGHGGTLEVKTTEGVGSEFIITLPFKTKNT